MRLLAILTALFIAMLLVACGGDGDGGDATATDTPSAGMTPLDGITEPPDGGDEPSMTDEPATGGFSLPDSTLEASLTQTYDTSGAAVTDQTLPVPAGSVIARWYQADGLYVVYYDGLDLAVTGALCPGNSIQTTIGFDFVSNAPAGEGACSTATTLVPAPTGVRLCDGKVLYLTAIPVETEGTLYGTIERYRDDGTIIGLTSTVVADATAAPAVDLSSCSTPAG